MPHQHANLVGEGMGRLEVPQQFASRLDAGNIVVERTNAPIDGLCGGGLADVVQKGSQHQQASIGRVGTQLRGDIDDEARMRPHVALGVPAGVLGHAYHGMQLREEA